MSSAPVRLDLADTSSPTAEDPVCKLTVYTATAPGGSVDRGGRTYHFCSETCRRRFMRDPERYQVVAREAVEGGPAVEPPAPPPDAVYVCPTCPEVETGKPGACPRCGTALEPLAAVVDDDADAELRDMTRRAWVGVVLTLPLLALSLADLIVPGHPIETELGWKTTMIVQAALAVPVVFWCGWPLLARGWRAIRRWSPDLFTLIAVGVLAATAYSFAALGYGLSGIDPAAAVEATAGGGEEAARRLGGVVRVDPDVAGAGWELIGSRHGLMEPFFETAAAIVVLALIGQVLELRARRRSGAAIRQLMRLTPTTARVLLPDGREEDLPLELVGVGDRVRVKAGERIPVDGVIAEGTSAIDESLLTGEPRRLEKTVGGAVLAGTGNGLGPLVVRVTKGSADSLLAHVAHLVGRAQATRLPLRRTVDRIARWFVPLAFLAAAATFAGWLVAGGVKTHWNWTLLVRENWITFGVVCAVGVLIIACPAAVGLATPLAVVAGVNRAARRGVLVRDAASLEKITRVSAVLFDKTGTLTAGKPKLTAVDPGLMQDPDRVLALAAAVERGSTHPLGLAVVWEAVARKVDIPVAEDVRAVPGRGVTGTVGGERVVVGNRQFLLAHGVMADLMPAAVSNHRRRGHAVVMVGAGERCLGLIVFEDPVRPAAREAVADLRAAGMRVAVVSGDHQETAAAVAAAVGIEEVVADTPPAEKFAVVRRFQNDGRRVMMVGDGVNDAPALAAADVGVAMGSGTDAVMETAGMTLSQSDLRAIPAARQLGRATVRTIRQNLWLAFAFHVLAVPVAAGLLVPLGGGLLSPLWAAVAMGLSTLGVMLNSLRLNRMRESI